jgi:phenylacetate-coenzyme A ligase PaaK-like adenylate-forming protein
MNQQWNHKIFNGNEADFDSTSLQIFRFQYENNEIYRSFVQTLGTDPEKLTKINEIPFLPISFFKTHSLLSSTFTPQAVFESSGTSGTVNSKHFIKDLDIYEESFLKGFESVYGPVSEYCILGLLPSYLERSHSSLVYMVNRLIQLSGNDSSGFFLHDFKNLHSVLTVLEASKQKTILIGVTYALLDFAAAFPLSLKHTIIMETGGMKGRRQEMVRSEVHEKLKNAFEVKEVHSEYGMTELLSQAYSTSDGIFHCPSWMKILLREEEDPLRIITEGAGIINVIDLANVYSCSFIATDDSGKLYADGSFEVLGRIDGSDIRGCSLMLTA